MTCLRPMGWCLWKTSLHSCLRTVISSSAGHRLFSDERSGEDDNGKGFAFEEDLKNFIARNLHLVEPGLTLYEDEGITGIEFDAGARQIDILAVDKNSGYAVIELKVSRGYDRVIGQLLRYTAWIKNNLAEENQNVRGIIIARTITEDL